MWITIVILAVDWIVLLLNGQTLLQYHAAYIAFLVIRLWYHQQPEGYVASESTLKQWREARGEIEQKRIANKCQICNAIKPARYYHCRRCNRCIYRMDHHCNWVGNCIGQYNSKVYLHLLANIFIHCLVILINIASSYSTLFDTSQYSIYYLIVIVPVSYACFESYRLGSDFLQLVRQNQTLIQSYKNVVGRKVSFEDNWKLYMGSNRLAWLLPSFESHQHCDLLELTYDESVQQAKEYIYADEYMFGPDDEEPEEFSKQK